MDFSLYAGPASQTTLKNGRKKGGAGGSLPSLIFIKVEI
jgi:hypothetical protein